MSAITWQDEATKRRIEALIREVESKSSAEIVVTVKPRSGDYRAADLTFAALIALVGLCIYVYAPIEFTDDLAPPSIAVMFFAAFACSTRVPMIRRWFATKALQASNTRAAARETFVDQNIACTRDRSGILIYVSTFEQQAHVVPDIGILRRENDGNLLRLTYAVECAIAQNKSIEAFEVAVRELGQWLADNLPPRIDDTNELSNEVIVS